MEEYRHGIRVEEEGSYVAAPETGTAGLQIIFGTAPVNLTENPEAAVDTPVVCRTRKEAQEKLGYSDDYQKYTLCQSMLACFQAFRVAPVVFVNVLDPMKHKKENPEKEYAVINGQVFTSEEGILKKSVVIKNGEEVLIPDTDYILTFDKSGKLVVTMISEKAMSAANVRVTSVSIAPEKVTAEDIIGGYDAETGKEYGMEVLRQVYPRTGMTAAFILAPGWSHKPEVAAVMIAKSGAINGAFTAECLLDISTAEAKKHTDVETWKKENEYVDSHAIALWPKAVMNGRQVYLSAAYGAMASYEDAQNDDVPNISPSNKLINVEAAITEDGTEIFMDRQQANVLNGAGVVTMIYEAGWRAWGNNTSAYPGTKELKDRWINCRRMFTWIANGLITTYHEKVDDPANYRLIENICDSENIRLNSYTSSGKLAGGRIEFSEEENEVERLLNGQAIFHVHVAVYTPAEDIIFILKFDPDMLKDSLTGTGGAS